MLGSHRRDIAMHQNPEASNMIFFSIRLHIRMNTAMQVNIFKGLGRGQSEYENSFIHVFPLNIESIETSAQYQGSHSLHKRTMHLNLPNPKIHASKLQRNYPKISLKSNAKIRYSSLNNPHHHPKKMCTRM